MRVLKPPKLRQGPRLSIRINIWILLSDTIVDRETAMLSTQTWFHHIQIIAIWISVGIRDNRSLRVLERGSHYILHHIPFSCNCEEPFCLYLEYGFPITFFHSGLPSIWAEDRKKWCLWKIYWVQYRRNLKLDFSITLHFCITRRHNNTTNREYWKVVHLKCKEKKLAR